MKKSSSPQFTPEQELLLWSIRVDHTKDHQIAEILKAGVDWNYVRETAIQQGIIPLLYKRLKEDMGDLVPIEELSELRNLFMANAVRNLRMTQQLIKVLDLLADAGIEAMPFKGPALAVQAYGDLSMRSFCDLDILIHSADLSLVYQILTDHDYIPVVTIVSRIDRKLTIIQEKDLAFAFQDIVLEIHWKIAEQLLAAPFDMDTIWDNSLPLSLNNRIYKTLSNEDIVLMLCFHGSKHAWESLKWLVDLIYMIMNHPEIRWNELFLRAESIGVKRIVLLGLLLSKEHGGIKYSSELEQLIVSDIHIQKIAYKIQKNYFRNQIWNSFLTRHIFYLKLRERFNDQIKFLFYSLIWRIFIPNRFDFNAVALSESLAPLYIFIRQGRLIKEFIPWIARNFIQKY